MKRFLLWFFPGLIVGAFLILGGGEALHMTSTKEYCVSCHIHPIADAAWKKSVHYDTRSGYRVACVDCHLPPKGKGYLWAKGKTCLLYTSDAADEEDSVDLGGRRIIKK